MSWFEKLLPGKIRTSPEKKKSIPEGLWSKCDACQAILFRAELERNLFVCPKCDHHMRLPARQRISSFLDEVGQVELGKEIEPVDKLKFKDTKRYKERLAAAQKATGEKDALIAMQGTLYGIPTVVAAFEFSFIGGSMGAVVGQKFCLAAQAAINLQAPLVCFSTSGGARMQESLISLMQMAKTSAALGKMAEQGLPFISVMVNPCTGGVSASLAMLGDINIAEPKALIGFAGPRVIQQIVKQTLPEGFQRSEFLVEHGMLDMIVDRREMRTRLAKLLSILQNTNIDIEIEENEQA